MPSNRDDLSLIEPREHQPGPPKKSTFGSIANRIGTSASGLISSSLTRPDPLSVCSSLASISGDSSKARSASASSSTSTPSSSITAGGFTRHDTWPARSKPQDQEQATLASHLGPWRHHPYQDTTTSDFDNFVSDSKRPQAQLRATTQVDQTSDDDGFHAGSTTGFAATQMVQFQAGVLADESCQADNASSSQLATESFLNSMRDRSGLEDFTSDWKILHVQHIGDIQTAQYRQRPDHRASTDRSSSALRSPKNFIYLSNMIESPSLVPEDGAEVVSLLSDPEFYPGGEFNDQLQSSIDDIMLEEESWMSGAMAPMSSQSRETSEPESLLCHLESKVSMSVASLGESPSEEQIALDRDYPHFPARYIEDVWGYFSRTKPKRLARGTVHSVAVKQYLKLDEANDKERTTALNRLVMVLNHLGPNPTEFGAQDQRD